MHFLKKLQDDYFIADLNSSSGDYLEKKHTEDGVLVERPDNEYVDLKGANSIVVT